MSRMLLAIWVLALCQPRLEGVCGMPIASHLPPADLRPWKNQRKVALSSPFHAAGLACGPGSAQLSRY
jgi:hypothetical protein